MESVGQGFRWGTAERACLQRLGPWLGDNTAEASPHTWLVWTLLWTGPLLGPSAGTPACILSSGPGLLHSVVASDGVDFLHRSSGLGEEGVPTHWWKPPQKLCLLLHSLSYKRTTSPPGFQRREIRLCLLMEEEWGSERA